MKIHKAKHQHIPAILEIICSGFNEMLLTPTIYRAHGASCYLEHLISQPDHSQFVEVLEDNGRVLGVSIFCIQDSRLYLNMMAIAPEFHGKALGKLLFKRLTDLSRKGNLDIHLDVFETNKRAYQWYLKEGFVIAKRRYLFRANACKMDSQVDFRFLNYPKQQIIEKAFGFSEVLIEHNHNIHRIGQIEESLFLRSEPIKPALSILFQVKEILGLKNCYVFYEEAPRKTLKAEFNISLVDTSLHLVLNAFQNRE